MHTEFVVGGTIPKLIVKKKKSRFLKAAFLIIKVLLSIGVAVILFLAILALTPPAADSQPDFQIPGDFQSIDPQIPLQGVFTIAHVGTANLLEGIINANLKKSGRVTWKPVYQFMPAALWQRSWVQINLNEVTYFLDISFFGYPLHFSETFRVGGNPRFWFLIPTSGSIGRLSLSESFISPITSLMKSTAAPFQEDLQTLSCARSLQLVPGKVVFSLQ